MGTDRSSELDRDAATDLFTEHRQLLFSIAYNLLGTVADTEDVLQETWLAWASATRDDVVNPRAYLIQIAVNQALSRLRRARRDRLSYVGPWLPEPLLTEPDVADTAVRADSLSLALLVVLETLSPLERAVFVLREAFGYHHTEIASILGRSPAAVRQVAHRARERVRARRPRYRSDRGAQRVATERFVAAAVGGDVQELVRVLAPDVTLCSDGGGKRRAALRVVRGREKVARLLAAVRYNYPPRPQIRYLDVNGAPAAVVFAGPTPYAVLVVELAGDDGAGLVRAIYGVVNPDKLTRVAAAAPAGHRAFDA